MTGNHFTLRIKQGVPLKKDKKKRNKIIMYFHCPFIKKPGAFHKFGDTCKPQNKKIRDHGEGKFVLVVSNCIFRY